MRSTISKNVFFDSYERSRKKIMFDVLKNAQKIDDIKIDFELKLSIISIVVKIIAIMSTNFSNFSQIENKYNDFKKN